MSHREKAALVERDGSALSLCRQAELLGISRSSLYSTPTVNPQDIRIRRCIDEIFISHVTDFGKRRSVSYVTDFVYGRRTEVPKRAQFVT